jgi:hypothetical protein
VYLYLLHTETFVYLYINTEIYRNVHIVLSCRIPHFESFFQLFLLGVKFSICYTEEHFTDSWKNTHRQIDKLMSLTSLILWNEAGEVSSREVLPNVCVIECNQVQQ